MAEGEGYQEALRRIAEARESGAEELSLSSLGLDELPSEIGQLTKLTSLVLSRNDLRTLPDWLGGLTSLQSLDLGGNGLSALPDWLGGLEKLRTLYLGGNGLRTLPDWLGGLTGLQRLYLSGNGLSTLPARLGGLTGLQSLDLSGNGLSTLPDWLGDLKNLRSLGLNGNGLSTLPAWLGGLKSLQYLDLGGNGLSTLPAWLGGLTDLRSLGLNGNGLSTLPAWLGGLTSLEEGATPGGGLSLEHNPLPAPYPALIAPGQPEATRNVLAWLRGERDPATLPDADTATDEAEDLAQVTEQRPAAYRFGLRDGRIDALPETAAPIDPEGAADLVAELAEKARDLSGRLATANSDPRVRRSVDRLLDALAGPSLRPGMLLSRSRSIEADRDAFDTPEARAELFPDAIARMNDVLHTLRDLMGLYPSLRAIEVERLALDIQRRPDELADIAKAADAIADDARRSELVAPAASAALTINDAAIAEAATVEVKAALIADKLLVEGNFVREVVRLDDQAAQTAAPAKGRVVRQALEDLGRKSWTEIDAKLPQVIGLLPLVALTTLMAALTPSIEVFAASIVAFKALSSTMKRAETPQRPSTKANLKPATRRPKAGAKSRGPKKR